MLNSGDKNGDLYSNEHISHPACVINAPSHRRTLIETNTRVLNAHTITIYNRSIFFVTNHLKTQIQVISHALEFYRSMCQWVMSNNSFDKPEYEFYKRPDLEFVKVITDFKNYLISTGLTPAQKVYLGGFSNGGFQANRFPLLHTDLIAATAIMGCGAFIYPNATYAGDNPTYPVGVCNISLIPDIHFNYAEFTAIPHLIMVGENDMKDENDAVPHQDNFDPEHAALILEHFGSNTPIRDTHYANYLQSIGMNCQLEIFEGLGHEYTDIMREMMFTFFDSW